MHCLGRGALIGAMALIGIGGLAPRAQAHHRDFTFLRDWFLPYAGEKELEYRLFHMGDGRVFEHEFEFEYGVSDHFAIEPGFVLRSEDGENLHFEATGIELRFSFGTYKPDTWLPAVNVEVEHPAEDGEPDRAEVKFIGSYYTRRGDNFTVNLNVGQELGGERDKESELLVGWMHDIGRHNAPSEHGYNLGVRAGIEAMHSFTEHHDGIGPTLVYRESEHFNLLATAMIATNHPHENPNQFKLIAEWEF